jgi:hypothetical protein
MIISILCSSLDSLDSILRIPRSIRNKDLWHGRCWSHMSNMVWRTWDLTSENTLEAKTAHMNAHEGSKLSMVGSKKNHRAARDANIT